MQLHSKRLPKSERYAPSLRAARQTFAEIEPLSVWYGGLSKSYSFDHRCRSLPTLSGSILASITVSRQLTSICEFYPISRDNYSDVAGESFEDLVLPKMRSWVLEQLAKPLTAILGHEQLIVEYSRSKHYFHELRFL